MNQWTSFFSTLFVAAGLIFLPACGDSGGSSSGNAISGSIARSFAAGFSAAVAEGDLSPYAGATIELRDEEGNVVDTDIVDDNGNFHFSSVAAGNYTIALVDPETGLEVTTLEISVADGDDVIIEGAVTGSDTDWSIEYEANDTLNNEDQNQTAINVATAAGVPVSEVLAMRNAGMGWGQICYELGVDPKVLGLEHSFNPKKKTKVKDGSVGKGCNEKNADKNPHCA